MSEKAAPKTQRGLSTFEGVFTPSLLTILGVIMYLRFGWILGNAGLVGTLLIVTISTAITFLTALSISAIATNQRTRTGGAYYMISRSLGIEAGGAVGIPLYFAQALSVALYTVGFAESVANVFPAMNEKAVALITTLLVALLALKSARFALKSQFVIMAAIAVSLLSLVFGTSTADLEPVMFASEGSEGFWVVFAVFFPAVTGIMAGVNMSGDLADPEKSIPSGTLAAVGVGYLIYMALPVILAFNVSVDDLIRDPLIMRQISLWGNSILLGVWGATLSSAVGSILGAPRVLQALSRDNVLPKSFAWLGRGSGPDDEPRAGTAVTLGVALIAVSLGNLNIIAPILTMFFLTTYGVLNITAGIERLVGNPSYRPKFKVHWSLSLLGAVGCIGVMFLINFAATAAAIVIVAIIFVWMESRELNSAWGDVREGVWMALTRTGLLKFKSHTDPKNWRPHILLLSGAPSRRRHLIEMAIFLTHNRALLTVATILKSKNLTRQRIREMEASVAERLKRRGIRALVRISRSNDPFKGAERLVHTYGLGPLVPNTILLSDSGSSKSRDKFCGLIRSIHDDRKNLAILRYKEDRGFGRQKVIDVWWAGLKGNAGLMMILAYLMQTSIEWRGALLRVRMIVADEEAQKSAYANLDSIIQLSRTNASTEVIPKNERDVFSVIKESSRDSDIVLLGLATPDENYTEYYAKLQEKLKGFPTTLLVLASEDIAFSKVLFPDDE